MSKPKDTASPPVDIACLCVLERLLANVGDEGDVAELASLYAKQRALLPKNRSERREFIARSRRNGWGPQYTAWLMLDPVDKRTSAGPPAVHT